MARVTVGLRVISSKERNGTMYAYSIYDNEPPSGKILEIIRTVEGFRTETEADEAANAELDALGDDTRYGYDVFPRKKRSEKQ